MKVTLRVHSASVGRRTSTRCGGAAFQIQDSKLKIQNSRLKTPDSKFKIPNSRPELAEAFARKTCQGLQGIIRRKPQPVKRYSFIRREHQPVERYSFIRLI
jgi:hypothetical protein